MECRFRLCDRPGRMLVRPAAGTSPAPLAGPIMLDAPTARSPWLRLWRDWLSPHWALLAVSLAMTGVVAVASAGYSKLIQLVMSAFQGGSPSVIWWGPLGVIGLAFAN